MILSKLIALAIYPLGLFFTLAACAFLLRLFGFARTGSTVITMAVGLLWIASTPVVARWTYWQLEKANLPIPLESIPHADVAILLGGSTQPSTAPRQSVELLGAADRIMHAADLYRTGKVRQIILSGGETPWNAPGGTEAAAMVIVLEKFGVPRSAMILESESRTTSENAAMVAGIYREHHFQSALLVTSAVHMRRALAVYRRAGVPVFPSSTDLEVVPPISRSVLDWLPDAEALRLSSVVTRELAGYLVYRLRGTL